MRFSEDWLIQTELDKISLIKKTVNDSLNNLKKQDLKKLSTRGHNSKQFSLIELINKNKSFEPIIEHVKDKIKFEFKKRTGIKPELILNNAWTVIGNTNSFHLVHCHTKEHLNIISTVIYLSVPPKDPNNAKTMDKGDFYYFLVNEGKNIYYQIYPHVGQFFIFPSWVWHGSYPQIKGVRQTLNLDFNIIR
jgi:hypothetical protein